MVRSRNVHITSTIINDIMGTTDRTNRLVLNQLKIPPPYNEICHLMCRPQSMAQWTHHSWKRYHKTLLYAHILREARVWLKIMINCLIPRMHYTDITHDEVCLIYALMKNKNQNSGAIIKLAMQMARVPKGHWYAFKGIITNMCHRPGVPEEDLDYIFPLYPAVVDVTRAKWPDT